MREDTNKENVETSVSVAITETGIEAKAKSRFVAAVDRLLGSAADWGSAHIEARTARRSAKTKGEVQLIEAVTQYGVEKLGADPAYAERAFARHFEKVLAGQENLDGVVRHAADQLRITPPTEAESKDDAELSEQFLDRFETYAEEATSEELRERWGRVLASEVRRPGTFSAKVMRIVDELDSQTARLFEQFCENLIGEHVPTVLHGEIPFSTRRLLVAAGLLVDPGVEGHLAKFILVNTDESGDFYTRMGEIVFEISSYSETKKGPLFGDRYSAIGVTPDFLGIPVYILTNEARAIATMLPRDELGLSLKLFERIAEELREKTDVAWCRLLKLEAGDQYRQVKHLDLRSEQLQQKTPVV